MNKMERTKLSQNNPGRGIAQVLKEEESNSHTERATVSRRVSGEGIIQDGETDLGKGCEQVVSRREHWGSMLKIGLTSPSKAFLREKERGKASG